MLETIFEFSEYELYAENTSFIFLSDHIYYDKVTNLWTQIDRNKQYEYETTFHSDISYAGCDPSKNESGDINNLNGAIIDNYTGIATLKQSIIDTSLNGVNEPNNYNHKYRFDRTHIIPGGNGPIHTGNYDSLYIINVPKTYTWGKLDYAGLHVVDQELMDADSYEDDEGVKKNNAIEPPVLTLKHEDGSTTYKTKYGNVSYKYAVRSKPPNRGGCVRYKVMGNNVAVIDSRETGVKYTGKYDKVYVDEEKNTHSVIESRMIPVIYLK